MWSENKFWVTAEIKSLIRNANGHTYMELIQKAGDNDNTIAEARATIWRNVATRIFSKFLFATDHHLSSGMKVMLAASFSYSQKYGISLNVTDIDPTYTIGDMQQRRLAIIKRLTERGMMEMNKRLPYPTPAKRIAVISSENAAGYTDFLNTLYGNSYGFTYHVRLFPAIMQRERTEQSILEALSQISGGGYDLIVIIRGGGASTDLLAFDSETVAVACAQCSIPVITGIGHQRDTSILDMVAYHNAITPTATAEYIIAQTAIIAARLTEMSLALQQGTTTFLQQNKANIAQLALRAESAMRLFVGKSKGKLDSQSNMLTTSVSHFIDMQKHRLDRYSERLELLHPDNILRRGYSITTCDGRIVTSIDDVHPGQTLLTLTANGTITSKTI